MAACEDGIAPVDPLIDKSLTDGVWAYVQGQGVPETIWGTTVGQEQYVIQWIWDHFGAAITKMKLATTRADLTDESYDHLVLAEQNLMGWGEHHWLLRRKGADWTQGGFMHVDDSALSLDWSNDEFDLDAVWGAVEALVGAGQQYGWLWS